MLMDDDINKDDKKSLKFVFKERFEIDFSNNLPKFNANNALAYKVVDSSDKNAKLFALVTNIKTPPRISLLPNLKAIKHNSVLKLVDYGVVFDAKENRQNMALIYKEPTGPKILDISYNQLQDIIKNKDKLSQILLSLYSAIETLKGHNITHRAIRPDNMYFEDEKLDNIVLGDCLAGYPAFYQPHVYEPIEAAMAKPSSKGNGSSKDDIYSLGASLLAFFNNGEIGQRLDNNTIIYEKMDKGSLKLLSEGIYCPEWLGDFFKGVLDDVSSRRWQYIDIYNNFKDKTYVHVNGALNKVKKALIIDGVKYNTLESIAYLIAQNPEKASIIIRSKSFIEWVKKGIELDEKQNDIINLISNYDEDIHSFEALCSKLCIILAPNLPVFYKNIKMFPQALPKALFFAKADNLAEVNEYKEAIENNILSLWYAKQEGLRAPTNLIEYEAYIHNKNLGYGIDRIVYDFDDDIPCVSYLFENAFVYTIGGILRAIENNAENIDELFDNSIIAYLRCRIGNRFEPVIKEINTINENHKKLAVLKLYVDLQNKFGPKKLVKTTKLMAEYCASLVLGYHNINTQKEVGEALTKASRTGLLENVYKALEEAKNKEEDAIKFNKSRSLMISLKAEKKRIEETDLDNANTAKQMGQRLVMALSVVVATIMIVISLLINL